MPWSIQIIPYPLQRLITLTVVFTHAQLPTHRGKPPSKLHLKLNVSVHLSWCINILSLANLSHKICFSIYTAKKNGHTRYLHARQFFMFLMSSPGLFFLNNFKSFRNTITCQAIGLRLRPTFCLNCLQRS